MIKSGSCLGGKMWWVGAGDGFGQISQAVAGTITKGGQMLVNYHSKRPTTATGKNGGPSEEMKKTALQEVEIFQWTLFGVASCS